MKALSISKPELRSGLAFGLALGCGFALFSVPMIFSDSVNVTYSNGFTGEETKYTGPGRAMVWLLLLFPVVASVFGIPIGVMQRRTRQLALLGAANPNAPAHLHNRYKLNFVDRLVHRLKPDGTDKSVGRLSENND
mmetsp:Transcript_16926/g.21910  ORF Transcript_16926/g.21910 Transcript_16926/m.21910 type:complete len:136 (-) Transcript_16926:228-635(-)